MKASEAIQAKTVLLEAIKKGDYRTSGDEAILPCPNCPPSKSPKLYVHVGTGDKQGLFVCYRCDFRGRLALGLPSSARDNGEHPPQEPSRPHSPDELGPPLGGKLRGNLDMEAVDYLESRGMTRSEIDLYQPRRKSNYVCFPVYDRQKNYVGYVGRLVAFTGPRYLYPDWMKKSECLWPIHLARGNVRLILVEGVFDALAVKRACPEADVLALLGSSISEPQIRMIFELAPSTVRLMLDPDAITKAKAAATMLGLVMKVYTVKLTRQFKDPGEASPDAIREAVNDPIRSF